MPYPRSRLIETIIAFRDGKLNDLKLGRIPRHLREGYNLRRVEKISLAQASSWVDDDHSADEYDPKGPKKRRLPDNSPRSLKKVKQDNTGGGDETTVPAGETPDAPLSRPFITLKVKTDEGVTLLRDLAKKHGTGYEEDFDGGEGLFMKAYGLDFANLDPEERDLGRLLSKAYLEELDEACAQPDNFKGRVLRSRKIPDEDENCEYPKCNECKEAKARCLMKKGIPPCNRCQRRNLVCVSNTSETEPDAEPDADVNAVTRVVDSEDAPTPTNLSSTPKTPIQVIRSHYQERNPTFTSQAGTLSRNQIGTSSQNPIELDSPTPPPPSSSEDKTIWLETNWAHPIDFQHLRTTAMPCHFCFDFRYGVYGLGSILVEVFQFKGCYGFEELGGGHRENGEEATRMCVMCSLRRLHMSRCKNHQLQKMQGQCKDFLDVYKQQLFADTWDPPLSQGIYLTCSLCPAAAFWECRADQRLDQYGRKLANEPGEGQGRGCGLILCDRCCAKVEANKGRLERVSNASPEALDQRADVEFLFLGSLLHKAYEVVALPAK